MKKVPETVLNQLVGAYRRDDPILTYFQGGHDWSDGVLYEYEQEGRPHILKVKELPAEQTRDMLKALDARLSFVRFLGDRGIDIVHPERTLEGSLYTQAEEGDRAYVGYSYRKREGVPIFSIPGEEHEALFGRWGETLGRMHAAAKEYPVWHRLPDDPEGNILGWEQEWGGFHTWCKDDEVKASWRKLKTRLEALPIERSGHGFTHNDLHLENLLVHRGNVTVLDFDVSNPHWFACDLSVAIYSLFTYAAHGKLEHPPVDSDKLKRLYRSLIRGYESANRLDAFWFDRMNLFLQYRRMLLFIVFFEDLSRRNPAFCETWRNRILEEAPFPDYQ